MEIAATETKLHVKYITVSKYTKNAVSLEQSLLTTAWLLK